VKIREEISGLSMDSDLREDEDDEGMFGSTTSGSSLNGDCREKSSGNQFLISFSMLN
jgi:hypothetical protein